MQKDSKKLKVTKARRKVIQEERDRLRRWDPCSETQMRSPILVDSALIVIWLTERWKVNGPEYRNEVHRTANRLDQTDLRFTSGQLDLCQHIHSGLEARSGSYRAQGKRRGSELEQ